ncbi:MAG: HD domain-containing protein [Deltaproteobacteria bacterium]|jgi:HD superfamily phosphodiesterase|nr:HD domain-containing protein [Deltaproteobacteria bacterium]MBW2504410.1 HD domain-containing protein [Deltaproteobacteria bacterium]MBW2520577.1 HD domain-containing protein [Deltaproteobacteria bacterium]
MKSLAAKDEVFLRCVSEKMQTYFGMDKRRISHALMVAEFARKLIKNTAANPVETLCAAYLHDIGIHEAERKYQSTAGKWQEIEGPPIAEEILKDLGAGEDLAKNVLRLIGKHHTIAGVDSEEFRILWDADALVNFSETLQDKPDTFIESKLERHMATSQGLKLAREMFLNKG